MSLLIAIMLCVGFDLGWYWYVASVVLWWFHVGPHDFELF